MIGFNHCRVLSLCLLGSVFLVACTRRQQFWVPPTVREIEEVRSRTVPSNGSLLRVSEADNSSSRRPVESPISSTHFRADDSRKPSGSP